MREGILREDERVLVSVDWARAPKGERVEGTVEIEGACARRTVRVPVFNPASPRPESLKGFVESGGLRFAYGFDGAEPRELAAGKGVEVTSKEWAENVLNATTKVTADARPDAPGAHVLRIYMPDPGVVLDKIVLNTGGQSPSYLRPPETRVVLK
ncbi:MAG TPA: hypothetical protein VF621_00170 [Pyrinomonadaceae bacterium]